MKTLFWICGAILLGTGVAGAADGLVIHEWGTMTCLVDEDGKAIPGINSDDEPAPLFVHRVTGWFPPQQALGKSVPEMHPDVTVRLETPVLYVHAPPGFAGPLDVKVSYRGGWLTEFYPDAQAEAPGIATNDGHVGHITASTVGSLHWAGLKIGGDAAGPATKEHVWTSPRKVAADAIGTPSGESEKFLFYRGVGTGEPSLVVMQERESGTVTVDVPDYSPVPPEPFWLADIRADGSVAFRKLSLPGRSLPFQKEDYSAANMTALRGGLEEQLIGAGLYKDEAEALLNTWEVSYFKSPGLRLFYLWPQSQVDEVLPLTVSPAAEITRVMVGRIELVTPEKRAAMARIGDAATSPDDAAKLFASLGRFRNALMLDEERRRPTPGLAQFMQTYRIAYYQP